MAEDSKTLSLDINFLKFMKDLIPIILLTKDEPNLLQKTIDSILERTSYPYELFVVDNDSCIGAQLELLQKFEGHPKIQVIYNSKNEWILGFNKAIEIIQKRTNLSADYLVLTDGDIVVPEPSGESCWLRYLKTQMDQNSCVGKLGLALDLNSIKDNKLFKNTYQRELAYKTGPQIGDLIIAPVDTTLAIYRWDLFVFNTFKMLPGHGSLTRPHYYTCRSKQYEAIHLGWENYINYSQEQLRDKVRCFTKYAGYIDPIILNRVDIKTKYFYLWFRYLYRAYWSVRVIFYWFMYITPRFPRRLNEIQAKRR